MPLRIQGVLQNSTDTVKQWLAANAMPPRQLSAVNEYLPWLLAPTEIELTYQNGQQARFIEEMNFVQNPPSEEDTVEGQRLRNASKSYFRYTLSGVNRALGHDRVNFDYVCDLHVPAIGRLDQCYSVEQDEVGISKTGKTKLYTGGFADCLAMVLTPVEQAKKGALLFHLKHLGPGSDVESLSVINRVLLQAPPEWGQFDVTLLMGKNMNTITIDDLRGKILQLGNQHIREIYDWRPFRQLMAQILVDPMKKIVFLMTDANSLILWPDSTWENMDNKTKMRPKDWKFNPNTSDWDKKWTGATPIFSDKSNKVWACFTYN